MPWKGAGSSNQLRMAAKAIERKAVKKYMAPDYNAMNLYWADQWLRQRPELGERHHRILYAIEAMHRLRPELEF